MKRVQFVLMSFIIVVGIAAAGCNKERSGVAQHNTIGKVGETQV